MSGSLTDRELKNHLQEMGDYDFEHFVADLWEQRGWLTEVEQQSNDAGVDVRAVKNTPYRQKQLIQAKRYSDTTKVGGPDIQQYYGLKDQEQGVDSAIIVTTSSFTRSARQRANDLNVKLVDGDDLVSMINSQNAHSLVDEYIEVRDRQSEINVEREPDVSDVREASPQTSSHEPTTTPTDDQIQVLDVPFLDIEYTEGSTPEDANLTKTWRYYAIWAGILLWIAVFAFDSIFAVGPVWAAAIILTPTAIALDSFKVGALDWKDSGWLLLVLGSAVPVFGVIPTARYLLHRRGMRLDQIQNSSVDDDLS